MISIRVTPGRASHDPVLLTCDPFGAVILNVTLNTGTIEVDYSWSRDPVFCPSKRGHVISPVVRGAATQANGDFIALSICLGF